MQAKHCLCVLQHFNIGRSFGANKSDTDCFFEGGGLLVVDLLLIVAPFVCGDTVIILCFAMQYFLSFLVLHLMRERERERELVALIVFQMSGNLVLMRLFLAMPWFGLLCVSVVFPGNTRLSFWSI